MKSGLFPPPIFNLVRLWAYVSLALPCYTMPNITAIEEAESGQVGISASNDARYFTWGLLLDEDRYFSQGIDIFWSGAPHPIEEARETIRILGNLFGASGYRTSLRIGQDIFTPNDLAVSPPLIRDDRTFTGWTHVDIANRYYLRTFNKQARLHLQVDLGVVGPLSLAEDVQVWFHEIRRKSSSNPELDPDPSEGWSAQYGQKGFPGRFQMSVNYGLSVFSWDFFKRLRMDWGAEGHVHSGLLYGNFGLGASIRIGLMERRMYSLNSAINGSAIGKNVTHPWELFLFAHSKISHVAWNRALTGGPGSDVQIARLLWQNQAGIAIQFPYSLELSVSVSAWSRETKRSPQNPFQQGHTDYRPDLQNRNPWMDHGFGTIRFAWNW